MYCKILNCENIRKDGHCGLIPINETDTNLVDYKCPFTPANRLYLGDMRYTEKCFASKYLNVNSCVDRCIGYLFNKFNITNLTESITDIDIIKNIPNFYTVIYYKSIPAFKISKVSRITMVQIDNAIYNLKTDFAHDFDIDKAYELTVKALYVNETYKYHYKNLLDTLNDNIESIKQLDLLIDKCNTERSKKVFIDSKKILEIENKTIEFYMSEREKTKDNK